MAAMVQDSVRRRWSTRDVEPRRALAYWIDTICQSFLEIDIESPNGARFYAQLDQTDFGAGKLYRVEADMQTVRRTPARIAHSPHAYYFLMQLRHGEVQFRQYGRECRIGPGDCLLVDSKHPYHLEGLGPTHTVAIRFPQDWLKVWLPAPEKAAGCPFRAREGWSAALSAAMSNLEIAEPWALALPPGVVAEQLAALLALAAGPDAQPSTASAKLVTRLKRTLRERCHEADLSPGTVADQHGISKRYLHHLFAMSGATFGQELMQVRLGLARRLLADRRYARLSIGELSSRCGFVEPSHFTRRFRMAFGIGPRAFRRTSAAPVAIHSSIGAAGTDIPHR
ncbi:MAG TPA: AraC family transcriptional regulator [Steroidobacteraceae bacterium]|nr:AraC family transcriptional regulator [Steroidobacteraceae bacterium]